MAPKRWVQIAAMAASLAFVSNAKSATNGSNPGRRGADNPPRRADSFEAYQAIGFRLDGRLPRESDRIADRRIQDQKSKLIERTNGKRGLHVGAAALCGAQTRAAPLLPAAVEGAGGEEQKKAGARKKPFFP